MGNDGGFPMNCRTGIQQIYVLGGNSFFDIYGLDWDFGSSGNINAGCSDAEVGLTANSAKLPRQ